MTDAPQAIEEHLRTALRQAAISVQRTPPPLPSLETTVIRRSDRGFRLVAAAVIVAVLVVGLTIFRHDSTPSVQTPAGSAPRELPASQLLPLEANITVVMQVDLYVSQPVSAAQAQLDAVRSVIRRSSGVRSFAFIDQATAYREFRKTQTSVSPGLTPAALPVEFRLVLAHCDAQATLMKLLGQQPGVNTVNAGDGLPHVTAQRLAGRSTLPPMLMSSHCGYRQPSGTPIAKLTIAASGTLKYQATQFAVPAGVVEITLTTNVGFSELVFDDPTLHGFVLVAPRGPIRGKVELKPGSYTIYNPLPGHREAGEQAIITAT